MAQQTSTDWLIEQVKSKEWQDMFIWHKEEVFEQAKEMHKQEIINAWYNGYINQSPMIDEENCGEEFYQETYNI
jgi:hypothetical protein